MMKKYLLFFLIFFIGLNGFSQDTATIHFLMKRIYEQQVKTDEYFMHGVFPSYISGTQKFKQRKKDNTIFYNVLIDYLLTDYQDLLSPENKILADSIKKHTVQLLPQFKNIKGRNTYNYWRTDSSFKFPYTWWIPLLRGHVTLPDDMDDTVLGLLAGDAPDSVAEEIHRLMQQYTNQSDKLKTTLFILSTSVITFLSWGGTNWPPSFQYAL